MLELERLGFDISSDLWSAELLLNNTEAIKAVHNAFLENGAQALLTSAYQVRCSSAEWWHKPEQPLLGLNPAVCSFWVQRRSGRESASYVN